MRQDFEKIQSRFSGLVIMHFILFLTIVCVITSQGEKIDYPFIQTIPGLNTIEIIYWQKENRNEWRKSVITCLSYTSLWKRGIFKIHLSVYIVIAANKSLIVKVEESREFCNLQKLYLLINMTEFDIWF